MAYIPQDARWYIGDVILEHSIEGDPRNIIHINVHLVQAGSPSEAFAKATKLGKQAEHDYENSDSRQVRVRFRGLRELMVMHEELEDGAELFYEELVGVPEKELRRWITPKKKLAVFAPRRAKFDGPNYMPKSIMETLKNMGFGKSDLEGDEA
jgi:hypothetical protein